MKSRYGAIIVLFFILIIVFLGLSSCNKTGNAMLAPTPAFVKIDSSYSIWYINRTQVGRGSLLQRYPMDIKVLEIDPKTGWLKVQGSTGLLKDQVWWLNLNSIDALMEIKAE